MNYRKKVEEFVRQDPKKAFRGLLRFLRRMYQDYLDGKISDEEVSNSTAYWYATNDRFSDLLIEIDGRVNELGKAMDITHPDFSDERKRRIVKELIQIVDEILQVA